MDSAIRLINHYPLDNSIDFASVYPLKSDLSGDVLDNSLRIVVENLQPRSQCLHCRWGPGNEVVGYNSVSKYTKVAFSNG